MAEPDNGGGAPDLPSRPGAAPSPFIDLPSTTPYDASVDNSSGSPGDELVPPLDPGGEPNVGRPNEPEPTRPGEPGPPESPYEGPPVIFDPGPPILFPPGPPRPVSFPGMPSGVRVSLPRREDRRSRSEPKSRRRTRTRGDSLFPLLERQVFAAAIPGMRPTTRVPRPVPPRDILEPQTVKPLKPSPDDAIEGEVIPAPRGRRVHDYEGYEEDIRREREADRVIEGEVVRGRTPARRPRIGKKPRGPFGTREQGNIVIIGRGNDPHGILVGRDRVPIRRGEVIVQTSPPPLPVPRPPQPPRPEPVPQLPVPAPTVPETVPEAPKPEIEPVKSPRSRDQAAPLPLPSPPVQNPVGIAAAAALGLAIWQLASTTPRSRSRPSPRPSPQPVPSPAPTATAAPAPAPIASPAPAAPAPPAPPLTPVTTASVGSRCTPDPEACKRAKNERKKQRDAKCKAFIKIPVRAHKKSVCVQDLAKYLFRKFKSKAQRELRKELKRRGIELVRRPRRPKVPDIEVGGGIEIDVGDLLGK